ncbi:putative Adenylate cyclase with CHASE2 sensor domain [Nitrospira defluvii]|jgi:adenylate cyclase|uniref:Putative Adenylate cyclase with CHASE2 sensor domain n=1 Tax=Nitrospira defluvii TaxID=330214 RepID=D8PCB6_9BACT|nr:putative Adenylate cyclase with CHASE2 sensor domain [Nitrospira defluvii]
MTSTPFQKKVLSAVAVGLTVFALVAGLRTSRWFEVAELKALDHLVRRYADPAKADSNLVLLAIDESSLEAFGRWPWPRDRFGYVVRYLKQAGARAVVFDVMFFEADENAEEFDQSFADDLKAAGNVFLPMLFQAEPAAIPPEAQPRATVTVESSEAGHVPDIHAGVKLPIPMLAQQARGLGVINLSADADGPTRRVPLLGQVNGNVVPHLSLAVAQYLLGADRLSMRDGRLQIGTQHVPLGDDGSLLIDWHGSLEQTYHAKRYSIGRVLQAFAQQEKRERPSLDPALFKDKIVFVAGTAAGLYDLRVTPFSASTPGVLIHMAALDNLLHGQGLQAAPRWFSLTTLLLLCLASAGTFMLFRSYPVKFGVTIGLAVAYYGLVVHGFAGHERWLELVFPEAALALTFGTAATVEYVTEGKQRRLMRAVFDKYMSSDVVEEIMRNPEAIKLGGEKKEITIFFSDIAGFTTISEKMSPEDLVTLLNRYLSAMTTIIKTTHRGNVNKYLGDGIMALFGAPLDDPKHASLACYAALDCQVELARLREVWKREGLPEIGARIGLNSGPCIVGNMGSEERMEYTVTGDSVNLASRLEGASKYYDTLILIGQRTAELAKNDVEVREIDLLRVKGKKEPVVVFELLARKGQLDDKKRRVIDVYLEGLTAYKMRNFSTACTRFSEAVALDPSDGPSRVYLERSTNYRQMPPPVEWDGVYEMTSK